MPDSIIVAAIAVLLLLFADVLQYITLRIDKSLDDWDKKDAVTHASNTICLKMAIYIIVVMATIIIWA